MRLGKVILGGLALIAGCSANTTVIRDSSEKILYQDRHRIVSVKDSDNDGKYDTKTSVFFDRFAVTKAKDYDGDGKADVGITCYILKRDKDANTLEEFVEVDIDGDKDIDFEVTLGYDRRQVLQHYDFIKIEGENRAKASDEETSMIIQLLNTL